MKNFVRGNTPLLCQKAIAKEIQNITAGMLFDNAEYGELGKGDARVPMRVYIQGLPVPDPAIKEVEQSSQNTIAFIGEEAETAVLGAPWCNVKIDKGYSKSGDGQKVTFAIIFCNYCKDKKKNGHEALLNLFQRIYERFSKEPLLESQYASSGFFKWEISEEDTYPYFFGVVVTEFDIQGISMEGGDFY